MRPNIDILLGAQLGDEGKGHIVDHLCGTGRYGICVKVNGSDNAGHTATLEDGTRVAMNQIPVGALHGMHCVIARGCIVNLEKLDQEVAKVREIIREHNLNLNWSLSIDSRCHVKTIEHVQRDHMEEESRILPIGTTLTGNGPAYSDKYARSNKRVCDVDLSKYPHLHNEVTIGDTSISLDNETYKGILVEGAHGVMLDIDHGTYPFVTSSGCTAGSALHSMGVGPHRVREVMGIVKPYLTRVGAGAFPTEMPKEYADAVREMGGEYGTVSGRARRIGWLDLPALRYAIRVAGITSLAVTKLDVLAMMPEPKACLQYRQIHNSYIPPEDDIYQHVEPIWTKLDPANTTEDFISLIEHETGLRVALTSSSSHRDGVVPNVLSPRHAVL